MKVNVFLSCALLLAEDQTLLNSRAQWCTFTMSCDFFFFFYHNKCLLLKQNYGCVLVFGLLSHTYFLNSLWRWILSKDILYGTVKKKMLLVITAYRIMPYLSCCVNFPHITHWCLVHQKKTATAENRKMNTNIEQLKAKDSADQDIWLNFFFLNRTIVLCCSWFAWSILKTKFMP